MTHSVPLDQDYDVLVVGARVAGASTAMLLARGGLRVALLDRGKYGADTVSTHALMRAGVLQLSRWGLLPTIVGAGTPAIPVTTFHYGGQERVQISIRPSPGVDALYAPRRYLLDRALVDAALEAGVHVLHGARVTELLRDGSGRVSGVRLGSGPVKRDISARFVIGADGISSVVAQDVGAETLREGRWATAVQYAYYSGIDAAGYEWAYGNGAGAGLIPTNDGLHCVFVGTTPERMRALRSHHGSRGTFDTVFRLAAPTLVDRMQEGVRESRQHGWAGVRGYVRRSSGPGWALVGDAAYFKDPITAHGITDGLRDAELLATAVLEAMSGARPEALALAAYETTRDRLSEQLFRVSDEVAAYDWELDEVPGLMRRVSAAMTDEVEYLESLPGRRSPDDRPVRR
jgi:flavin-dependent dehydrogenase